MKEEIKKIRQNTLAVDDKKATQKSHRIRFEPESKISRFIHFNLNNVCAQTDCRAKCKRINEYKWKGVPNAKKQTRGENIKMWKLKK